MALHCLGHEKFGNFIGNGSEVESAGANSLHPLHRHRLQKQTINHFDSLLHLPPNVCTYTTKTI